MNLLQIRTKFVQLSGRYDLVVDAAGDDYSDNGADFFINSGLRLIDRLCQTQKGYSRHFKSITAGDWYIVDVEHFRSVLEVWASDSDERWPLEKLTLTEFREKYYEPMSSVSQGTPNYFCIPVLGTKDEETSAIIVDNFAGTVTSAGSVAHFKYKGILIGPPADASYTIEILGLADTLELSADSDVNFWSELHEMAVLYAALYYLEVSYRNTEGAKDWMSALEQELRTVEYDHVEEQAYYWDQMKG